MSNSNATYKNNLTNIAKTRIMADRNMVKKDQIGYNESDIYFGIDESKLDNKFQILMIGSRDIENPYFGGNFMFSGKFPDQYPFFPPHVKAKTQGESCRFHPNYYVSGKCCVSILGTWSGPPWTSCQNLGTVAQTLKSLYIENPITQEPGWETCNDHRAKSYTNIVAYRTLEVAVLRMMDNPPSGFEHFVPIMEKNFLEMFPKLMEKLHSMKNLHGKYIKSPMYGMTLTCDIQKLIKLYQNKHLQLTKKYKGSLNSGESKEEVSVNSGEEINLNIEIKKKKKYTRKSPNSPAKNFEEGYEMVSENDGNQWKVYVTKNNQKRWKKIK